MSSSNVIALAFGVFRSKAAAVLVGPEGVGLIGLLQNALTASSTVAALGLSNSAVREIAATPKGDRPRIARAVLILAVSSAVLISFLLVITRAVVGRPVDDAIPSWALFWVAGGTVVSVFGLVTTAILQGTRNIRSLSVLKAGAAFLGLILSVGALLVWGYDGAGLFVVATPIATAIFGLAYCWRLLNQPGSEEGRLPLARVVGILRFGLPVMVATFAGSFSLLGVRTLVLDRLGESDAGLFHAAWTIAMTYVGIGLAALGADYYPRLAQAAEASVPRLVDEQMSMTLLVVGPALVGLLAVSELLLRILFSDAFIPAAGLLGYQLLGDVMKAACWPLGFVVLARGRSLLYCALQCVWAAVYLGGAWMMLEPHGLDGVGVAFAASYVILFPLNIGAAFRTARARISGANLVLLIGYLAIAAVVFWTSSRSLTGSLVIALLVAGLSAAGIRARVRGSSTSSDG